MRKDPAWERLDDIQKEADSYVRNANITTLPVDPGFWCRAEDDIYAKALDLKGECDGLLVFRDGTFHLFYQPDQYRGRFNFAHEVAHFLLDEHHQAIRDGRGEHKSQTGFITDIQMEREADCFASALLMPESVFWKLCPDPNFRDIGRTAAAFDVSLTSAAIRTVQYTPLRAALIVSTAGKVAWGRVSEGLARSGIYDVKKGKSLPPRSKSCDIWSKPSCIPSGIVEGAESCASEWFAVYSHPLRLWEEVFCIPRFGTVLTLLTAYDE